jgi:hypothetical protein
VVVDEFEQPFRRVAVARARRVEPDGLPVRFSPTYSAARVREEKIEAAGKSFTRRGAVANAARYVDGR